MTIYGGFDGALDLGGDGAAAMAIDADGNVYLTGTSDGGMDMGSGPLSGLYVASFASDGTPRWSAAYGKGASSSIALDSAGNVYLAGSVGSSLDFGSGPFWTGTTFVARVPPPGD